MPKGVEHHQRQVVLPLFGAVITYQMPKGVEHESRADDPIVHWQR